MNNIICFIPARGGSKGVPGKNIKDLGGKPLIAWTIDCAEKSRIFQRIIVDTDSEEIAKTAREFGAEVMMRPVELAQDNTTMYDVLKNELPRIDPVPELVMLLQPTVPFRKPVHIKVAVGMLTNQTEYDSLITVETVPDKYNPAQVIVTTSTGPRMASGAPIYQRINGRKNYPLAYIPTGSIYFFKMSNLERGNFYGEKTMLMETEGEINIDNMRDWEDAVKHVNNLATTK